MEAGPRRGWGGGDGTTHPSTNSPTHPLTHPGTHAPRIQKAIYTSVKGNGNYKTGLLTISLIC